MTLHLTIILLMALFSHGGISRTAPSSGAERNQNMNTIGVIPRPVSYVPGRGYFLLNAATRVVCDFSDEEVRRNAAFFAERMRMVTGLDLPMTTPEKYEKENIPGGPPAVGNIIIFSRSSDDNLGGEGYRLGIDTRKVDIRANSGVGLFYATQTLLQLLPPEAFSQNTVMGVSWSLTCATIVDTPRFSWRGMHLDVCRHFFPVEFVKKYIDYIAMYKMNRFHWHLTDDQGWRIEIRRYPKLTGVGAWRNGSMVGHASEMRYDSIRYGGFYTQNEIREVVAYAAERYVTVVPEIEMPGHAVAALAAHPELSCTGGPFEVGKAWGVYDDVFCPKDTTFTFLENVLTEVADLFPGKYIHIGGDECPKERWKECASCQELIREENLGDEEGLQSYFIRRIEKFLNGEGKQIVGWDEILEGGLAPNATVMSWRGTEGGIAAARMRHDAVMTPGSHCYFDHYQGDPRFEPLAIGGYTPVETVYAYEPVPAELEPDEKEYILGAQGNVWTEYIATPAQVEYMALPRMAALSEVVWSPHVTAGWDDFQSRLIDHFHVLDLLGVNYSRSMFQLKPSVGPAPDRDGVLYTLNAPPGAGVIRYTTDATDPSPSSPRYLTPLPVKESEVIRAAAFDGGSEKPLIIEQDFTVSKSTGKPVTLTTPPHENYDDGGPFTLVNGIRGDFHRFGRDWLGFWGPDMEAVIDLQEVDTVFRVSIDVFVGEGSWIYPPTEVEVLLSVDSVSFSRVAGLNTEEIERAGNVLRMNFSPTGARFVKVIARNAGAIPEGKPGAGHDAWLFVDEIIVD